MTRDFSTDATRSHDSSPTWSTRHDGRRRPGYSQGVHFVVLTGDAVARFWQTTDAEAWFAADRDGVLHAPVIVLPVADPDAYTSRYAEPDKAGHGLEIAANWPVPFWLTDTAMAVQNLLLLAEAQRLGALYFGIFRNVDVLFADLGVPSGMLSVGAIALGHRADNRSTQRIRHHPPPPTDDLRSSITTTGEQSVVGSACSELTALGFYVSSLN